MMFGSVYRTQTACDRTFGADTGLLLLTDQAARMQATPTDTTTPPQAAYRLAGSERSVNTPMTRKTNISTAWTDLGVQARKGRDAFGLVMRSRIADPISAA